MNLFDWQVPYADRISTVLRERLSGLLILPPGGGKTYIAAEVHRRKVTGRLYHVVFCPKSVVETWRRVLDSFGLADTHFVINYEQLTSASKYAGSGDLGKWNTRGATKLWIWNPKLVDQIDVIFDEAHRCNGQGSKTGELLIGARKQEIPHLLLTATPPDSPLKMQALGISLDLFPRERFWDWAISNGARKSYIHKGFEFPMYSQKDRDRARGYLEEINKALFPERGVVMTHEELRRHYPKGHLYLQPLTIEDNEKFEAKHAAELQALAKAVEDSELKLVEALHLHQELEFRKIPGFVEQAKDLLAEGSSVVCFVCYRQTAISLAEELDAGLIIGEQSSQERQKLIDDFQANKTRKLVLTVSAGSEAISLHDLHGDHPRWSLLSPIWNPVILKQALGRIQRAGGKSVVNQRILVAGGMEERIYRRCLQRLQNMGALTGDEGFNLE